MFLLQYRFANSLSHTFFKLHAHINTDSLTLSQTHTLTNTPASTCWKSPISKNFECHYIKSNLAENQFEIFNHKFQIKFTSPTSILCSRYNTISCFLVAQKLLWAPLFLLLRISLGWLDPNLICLSIFWMNSFEEANGKNRKDPCENNETFWGGCNWYFILQVSSPNLKGLLEVGYLCL